MRLFSLAVGLAVVWLVIRELRTPEVAAQVDRAFAVEMPPTPSREEARPHGTSADPAKFSELLALAGWDSHRFAEFRDDSPLSAAQQEQLLQLLRRLKSFDSAQLASWATNGSELDDVGKASAEHRGELVHLSGRVIAVESRALPPELAARLEMSSYAECQMELPDDAGLATIITGRVPSAWSEMQVLDEPAEASGVFIKLLPESDSAGTGVDALFVSPEIAWHPERPQPPFVSLGESLLGSLGMDIGLLDGVLHREQIDASEREAFYQMLAAVGRAGPNQLNRLAQGNLEAVRRKWSAEEQRLATLADETPTAERANVVQRQRLAREAKSLAAEGRYSVAPLFNDAEIQVGELVVVDGTVRRVARIDVGKSPDGSTSDVARRFGIDHYYEMDVFTDDSQNNPLVFCVRELPAGFPMGEGLHEPVRIAGFFFKSWGFRSRRSEIADSDRAQVGETRQIAPLLIGRSPVWLDTVNPHQSAYAGYFAAALFLAVLAGIWAAGWWFAREDRRFVERTLAERFALPTGQTLDELDLDAQREP